MRFGFVDPKSASGYIYPKAMLREQGKDPDKFFAKTVFLGSHNRVIDAVLNGVVDAGATYSEALEDAKIHGLPVNDLTIIAQTEPIPKDAIVARPDLDDKLLKQLAEAFKELSDTDPKYKKILNSTAINGFVDARDETYDVIRKAEKLIG